MGSSVITNEKKRAWLPFGRGHLKSPPVMPSSVALQLAEGSPSTHQLPPPPVRGRAANSSSGSCSQTGSNTRNTKLHSHQRHSCGSAIASRGARAAQRHLYGENLILPRSHIGWKTSDCFPLGLSGPAVERRWLERAPRVQKASTELVFYPREASLGGLEASSGSPGVSEHPHRGAHPCAKAAVTFPARCSHRHPANPVTQQPGLARHAPGSPKATALSTEQLC